VIIPGLLLILVGVLNLIVGLGSLPAGYALLYANPEQVRWLEPKHQDAKSSVTSADIQFFGALILFAEGVLTAVFAFPVMIGGSAMLRCRGWFGAVVAALLALISPGGFGILGLIAGIWALAVLFNGNVRKTFR
jgi:hypothetical protein